MTQGAVSVSPILSGPVDGDWNTAFIHAFVDRLTDVMTGKEPAYPLMTAQVRDLLDHAVNEGKIVIADRTRTRIQNAGLATGLIDRLPTFPNADMSEILDVREDLRGPLTRFRKEVAELAPKIESTPGTSDFANEVEDLWIATVAPAIREIEERINGDTYLKTLMKAPDGVTATGSIISGLGITFGQTQGLISLGADGASSLLGAAAALTPVAANAYR